MKRLYAAIIIVVLLVGLTWYSCETVETVTDDMRVSLMKAGYLNGLGDYEMANKKLEEYEQLFKRNEALFILFVDREHYNNLNVSLSGLYAYVGAEHHNDFNAELSKTLRHLQVVKEANKKLI